MTVEALLLALARAAPLGLVLPLPGVAARLALALVLAYAAAGATGDGRLCVQLPAELARGLALGLGVALPVWAARSAGRALGLGATRSPAAFDGVATLLAWTIFCAAGGATLLVRGFLASYRSWPMIGSAALGEADRLGLAQRGGEAFVLLARLALPGLLALALVELCAGLLGRFEHAAGLPVGAEPLARGLRPVVALLLFTGSLAAFWTGVGGLVALVP